MPTRIKPADLKKYLEKDVYRIAMKQHSEYVVLKFYRADTRGHKRIARSTERAYRHRRAETIAGAERIAQLLKGDVLQS